MESKKVGFVGIVMIVLLATSASSESSSEAMKLVSDGGNDIKSAFPRKMLKNGLVGFCPLILMLCEEDSNCLADCECRSGLFRGEHWSAKNANYV